MPRYVIERELPEAGKLTKDQLHAISQKSCDVLHGMGPEIQWIESYVTDDCRGLIMTGLSLGSVPWYTLVVKLALEVRGEISRVAGAVPQRLLRTSK